MGLLSGFYFSFLLKFIYTITKSFQHLQTLPLWPPARCPPYWIFNARLRNTRLSTRKKSLFLSWTLKKIVQTKLKWKLDKTECIEQCKGINHACGLHWVQIFNVVRRTMQRPELKEITVNWLVNSVLETNLPSLSSVPRKNKNPINEGTLFCQLARQFASMTWRDRKAELSVQTDTICRLLFWSSNFCL